MKLQVKTWLSNKKNPENHSPSLRVMLGMYLFVSYQIMEMIVGHFKGLPRKTRIQQEKAKKYKRTRLIKTISFLTDFSVILYRFCLLIRNNLVNTLILHRAPSIVIASWERLALHQYWSSYLGFDIINNGEHPWLNFNSCSKSCCKSGWGVVSNNFQDHN